MLAAARLLLYLGIVAVVAGLGKIHAAWIADPGYDYTESSRFAWSLAFVGVLALLAYGIGLPDLPRRPRSAVASSVGAAAGAAVTVSLAQLVVGDALLPRFVVLGSAAVLVPWYLLCVAVAHGGRLRATAADRVLIVGGDFDADMLRADLETSAEKPAALVAAVPARDIIGSGCSTALRDLVVGEGATVVVLDHDAQVSDPLVTQAAALHEQGLRVRTLTLFYSEWLGKLPASELERVSLMFDIGEVHRARYGRSKRVFDVILGLATGVLLVVCLPFVWIGDLVANRGPLFYRQERVGKNGEEFQILKFRTMRPATDGTASNEWTAEDDPRITPFGRVLRVTHVDELPQAVNILRGDLAMVGPRPEQPHYVAELRERLPFYDLRHLVRPGLTGWAQVKYGYAGDERDALEKLQYEFYYLRHQGLMLDIRILGRTIRTVFSRGGR